MWRSQLALGLWEKVARAALHGRGRLTCKAGDACECEIELVQLFTGRLVVRVIPLNLEDLHPRIFKRCEYFDLVGSLDDNSRLSVTNIRFTRRMLLKEDIWTGRWSHEGYIHLPGSIRFFRPDETSTTCDKVICELTNLSLGREVGPIEANVSHFHMRFARCADNEHLPLIEALKTSGVMSHVEVMEIGRESEKRLDQFVLRLCDLLTLASRSPVSCVAQYWQNKDGTVVKGLLREPPFDYPTRVGSLIEAAYLSVFIEDTYANYLRSWKKWDLANAIDHYVQAMSLNSAWSQAVGFFTALETVKSAFLSQNENRSRGFYVSRSQFAKSDVPGKVVRLLGRHFPIFKHLPDGENDALLGSARSLNRRAYKVVLKEMFRELAIEYNDDELNELVGLRNQIIHGGSPTYTVSRWRNSSEAYRSAARFASLVERVFLAVLGYRREFSPYDQSLIGVSPDQA